MNNVPDDWGAYVRRCTVCGNTYHASEGGCDCAEWDECAVCLEPQEVGDLVDYGDQRACRQHPCECCGASQVLSLVVAEEVLEDVGYDIGEVRPGTRILLCGRCRAALGAVNETEVRG